MAIFKKTITAISWGIIIGSACGFIDASIQIISNRYVQYNMPTLIFLTLYKNFSFYIFLSAISTLILYIAYSVSVEGMRISKDKFMKGIIWLILAGLAFFYIRRLIIEIKLETLILTVKQALSRILDLLAGRKSIDYVLNLLQGKLAITAMLVCGILAIPLFCWLLIGLLHRVKPRFVCIERLLKIKGINFFAVLLIALLPVLNLFAAKDAKISAAGHPNIILIVCDTLRPDHLGAYGYHRDTSRYIDAFSTNSFIFKNAYTQAPATVPSMWNIIVSRYQSEVPAKSWYFTMAEYFKNKNYKTAAFISQHYLEGTAPNLQGGFDIYDSKCTRDRHGLTKRKAESVTASAISWLDKNRANAFFLWLVYFEPHDPYDPPASFKGYYNKAEQFSRDRRAEKIEGEVKEGTVSREHRQFLINAYDEEIRYLDYEMGRLFDYLKNKGLYENSIIILTADHGEELGDNNRWDHCQLLSQEEIRIPLIIKLPAQKERVELEAVAGNIDIYPTLVEYFDKDKPPHYLNSLEGKSLIPLLNGIPAAETFAASFWKKQRSIVTGDYKYWITGDKEYFVNVESGEAIEDPAIRQKLRNQLSRIYDRYILKKDYYEETVEKLKSLGYMQ